MWPDSKPVPLPKAEESKREQDDPMAGSSPSIPTAVPALVDAVVEEFLLRFDSLLKDAALSSASLLPGPAGVAAAGGAVAFDVSKRWWFAALLSGLSMIPLAGYLPAVAKVGWNAALVDRELRKIETALLEHEVSAVTAARIHQAVARYLGPLTRRAGAMPILARAKRILERTRPAAFPSSVGPTAKSIQRSGP